MSSPPVRRAVVDTNVLVRALFSKDGPSAHLYEAARRGEFQLVLSPALLRELRACFFKSHVRRRYPLPLDDIVAFVASLRLTADIVPGRLEVDLVPRDPKGNPVVACAFEGRAGFVVTDDRKHLLPLGVVEAEGYGPVRIVGVPAFLALLRGGRASSCDESGA